MSFASSATYQSLDTVGLSNLGGDYEDIESEWDIAITHKRNDELKHQKQIKEFFDEVSKFESLWDQKTRSWLGSMPHRFRKEAIPLFKSGTNEDSEDYQLHPGYSWLTPSNSSESVEDPDPDFCQLWLGAANAEEQALELYMPLGRLFVNMYNENSINKRCNSNRTHPTRWTGYEVLISTDLALWIVFDEKSLASHARPWYPVSCRITNLLGTIPFKAENFPSNFSLARFLPSLSKLQHATFKDAEKSINDIHRSGKMRISEVEKSKVREHEKDEVKKREKDQSDMLLQVTIPLASKGKERADDATIRDATQSLHLALPMTSSFILGLPQDTPLVRQQSTDITRFILVPAHDPSNDGEAPLSSPESSSQNEPTKSSETWLTSAIKSGEITHMEQVLAMEGIDVNLPNASDEFPISLAVKRRDPAMVLRLLETQKLDLLSETEKKLLDDAVDAAAKVTALPVAEFVANALKPLRVEPDTLFSLSRLLNKENFRHYASRNETNDITQKSIETLANLRMEKISREVQLQDDTQVDGGYEARNMFSVVAI